MARRKEPRIPDAILDRLLAGADARTAFEQGGLLDELKKALAERALNAEMDHHLAGEGGEGNSRNGYGRKSVVTDSGKLALEIPRDRQASFDPQLIARYLRRFPGFDDKVISMYARGMSVREIVGPVPTPRRGYGVSGPAPPAGRHAPRSAPARRGGSVTGAACRRSARAAPVSADFPRCRGGPAPAIRWQPSP